MHIRGTRPPLAVLLAVLLLAPATAGSSPVFYSDVTLPDTGLSEDQKIIHALNRLAYGHRPGEVERVKAMGLERWIEQQLAPETLPDEGMQKKLAGLDTLRMSQTDLMVAYPPPQLLRGIERQLTTRMGMDPGAVAGIFPELAEMRARRERRERQQAQPPGERRPNEMTGEGMDSRQRSRPGQRALRGPQRIVMELSQAKLLRAIYSERQLEEVMVDFWFNHFNVFIGKGTERWLTTSYERDAIRPHAMGKFRDLLGATAQHPAMLFYLDNWQSADPNADQNRQSIQRAYRRAAAAAGLPEGGVALEIMRERGVDTSEIERRLQQLERREQNRMRGRRRSGRRGGSATGGRQRRPQNQQRRERKRGLNENYARELLELHTLGVDGGYTQQDVIEVARCLTGWTLTPLHFGQQFVYVDAMHDKGEKTVLDRKIKNGGQKDGDRVLDMLARHPATAQFISTKLARRFVSDNPPASLVRKMSKTFLKSDGDIRAVLKTMFTSEEFWSPEVVNALFKTPFEFVVSAARATGLEVAAVTERRRGGALQMALALREMGQPLYGAQPPTGYKDTAEAWVSTGALLSRMKISVGLAAGRLAGARLGLSPALAEVVDTPAQLVSNVSTTLLGRELSGKTSAAIVSEIEKIMNEHQISGLARAPAQAREHLGRLTLGWVLASPEFQRQ